MAGATGLEPATSGVTGRRSNQLSYAPTASTWAGSPTPPTGGCQANPVERSRRNRPFTPPNHPCKSGISRSTAPRRVITSFELALHAVEALVLSSEARSRQIENLGILGHNLLMQSRRGGR